MRIVCQKKESNTNRFTAADCWDSSVVRFQFDLPALIYDPIVITYATIAAVGQTFYFRLQVRKSYQVKCRTRKTMVFGFNISSIFEGNRKKNACRWNLSRADWRQFHYLWLSNMYVFFLHWFNYGDSKLNHKTGIDYKTIHIINVTIFDIGNLLCADEDDDGDETEIAFHLPPPPPVIQYLKLLRQKK